ncbi:MAG TPA: hypothetical protein VKX39_19190 [Bryobacteraceae bacterium]|jgi:hypothetical protein|nr:hypothetical protein [Bryobacteraceae bacterium]
MKKPVLLGVVFIAAVLAVIIYSSMNLARYRVEVCIEYQGRSACRTAAGSTRDFALRTATANACAQIASGVTDSTACERSEPSSVNWK